MRFEKVIHWSCCVVAPLLLFGCSTTLDRRTELCRGATRTVETQDGPTGERVAGVGTALGAALEETLKEIEAHPVEGVVVNGRRLDETLCGPTIKLEVQTTDHRSNDEKRQIPASQHQPPVGE